MQESNPPGREDEHDYEVVPQEPDDDTPMWDIEDEDEDRQKAKTVKSEQGYHLVPLTPHSLLQEVDLQQPKPSPSPSNS